MQLTKVIVLAYNNQKLFRNDLAEFFVNDVALITLDDLNSFDISKRIVNPVWGPTKTRTVTNSHELTRTLTNSLFD